MHLCDLVFPVYTLPKNYKRIWEEYNVLYIETDSGTYILDNKNISGNTLGERRLKLKSEGIFIPRKVYYTINQMIHSTYKSFIDTEGKLFTWKKSKRVPLKYYKVSKVLKDESSCIIHFKDINFPQRVNCRIAYAIQYAGILHTDFGYLLYEYCEGKKKDTYRKI
jgi:hypothetical protein